jgi:hypothetical protein
MGEHLVDLDQEPDLGGLSLDLRPFEQLRVVDDPPPAGEPQRVPDPTDEERLDVVARSEASWPSASSSCGMFSSLGRSTSRGLELIEL